MNEEYVNKAGDRIQLYSDQPHKYHVVCWKPDEMAHWFLTFDTEEQARKEFEKWR